MHEPYRVGYRKPTHKHCHCEESTTKQPRYVTTTNTEWFPFYNGIASSVEDSLLAMTPLMASASPFTHLILSSRLHQVICRFAYLRVAIFVSAITSADRK